MCKVFKEGGCMKVVKNGLQVVQNEKCMESSREMETIGRKKVQEDEYGQL